MEIVKATLDNVRDIANIEFNNGYRWSKYSFEQELKYGGLLLNDKEQTVFLAKENYGLVGYVSLGIKNKIGDVGLSVIKNHQGKGIGTKLLAYIIDFATKKNCRKITISVWENNKAIHLYKKHGFVIMSEKKNFYDNGDSVLYLELKLKKQKTR